MLIQVLSTWCYTNVKGYCFYFCINVNLRDLEDDSDDAFSSFSQVSVTYNKFFKS